MAHRSGMRVAMEVAVAAEGNAGKPVNVGAAGVEARLVATLEARAALVAARAEEGQRAGTAVFRDSGVATVAARLS